MTDPTTLEELAVRCEKADGAEQGPLDDLCRAIHEVDPRRPVNGSCRAYTYSLECAMSLVPKGWFTRLAMEDRHSHIWRWELRGVFGIERSGRAATPALALCAASLRALALQDQQT